MPPIWTGLEAKLLRSALRRTVDEFAELLGVHSRTVNKWEARLSTITPTPEIQAVLDLVLERAPAAARERFEQLRRTAAETRCAERGKLARTVEPRSRDVDADHEIVDFIGSDMASRRTFLQLSLLTGAALVVPAQQWANAAGVVGVEPGRIGGAEIDGLARAVRLFAEWDASGHGGLHRKAVLGQLHAVVDALQEGRSADQQRRLRGIAAELAQLAGFMTWDAGLPVAAQRYYLYALDACKRTGELDLGAKVIGDMSHVSLTLGQYDDSLSLVRTALAALPRNANPLVLAELHGHEATTYARFGREEEANTRRAVEAIFDAFDRSSDDAHRTWNDYIDTAEVECLAAAAYRRLAMKESEPARAAQHAQRAEAHALRASAARPDHLVRSRLFDQLRLSEIRMAQHEPEESAALARKTLHQAADLSSGRVTEWLHRHTKILSDRYGDVAAVADLRAEMTDRLHWRQSEEEQIRP